MMSNSSNEWIAAKSVYADGFAVEEINLLKVLYVV